uniref:Major facilitator superfamily (MFS) profile domain-containing protein n=1 Tax=Strigamia maritima TaxID=126957 RepID=T1J937_STRMM
MDVSRSVSPDGGWGWVVTAATSMIYFITFGLNTSHGIIMVGLMRELFPNDRNRLTLIPLLCNGITRLLAPLMVYFSLKSSYRLILFTGGLLLTLGLALSFMVPSVNFLIITLGVLMGTGGGGCVFPAAILTTLYFDKHVSLANGIYTAGASVGCVTVPLFIEYLLHTVGVRDTFLYMACLSLQICVAASLCQPVEWHMKEANPESIDGKSGCVQVNPKDRPVTHTIFDLKASDREMKQQLKKNRVVLTRFEYKQSSVRVRVTANNTSKPNNNSLILNPTTLRKPPSKVSLDNYNLYNRQVSQLSVETADHHQPAFDRKDSFRSSLSSRISASFVQGLRKASLPMSHPTDLVARCPLQTQPSIPEENGKTDMETKNSSMFSFFKNSEFYLLTLLSTGFYLNMTTFPIITPDYAINELSGTESLEMAAYLISALSLADFICRISLSWIWDKPFINKLYCFLFGNVIGGCCLIAASFAQTYQDLMILGIIDGFSTGISGVLVSVIFMQSIGPKYFGIAISTASLTGGVLMVSNGFLISFLKQQTGSYKLIYFGMGIFQLAGSAIWIICNFLIPKKKI